MSSSVYLSPTSTRKPAWLSGPRRAQKLIPSHPLTSSHASSMLSTLPTTIGKFFMPMPAPPPQERNGPPWMWIAWLFGLGRSEQRGRVAVSGSQVFGERSPVIGSLVVKVWMIVELSVYEYIPRAFPIDSGGSNVQ